MSSQQIHCKLLTFSKFNSHSWILLLFRSEPCVFVQTSTLICSACCTHILCIVYVLVYLKVVWRNEAWCLWKVKRNVCVHRPQTEWLCAPVCWTVWSGLTLFWMWFCDGCRFNSVYFRPWVLGEKIQIKKITFIRIHNIEMIQLKTNLT